MAQDTNNNLIVTKLTAPKTWNGGYKTEWKYAPEKSLNKSSNGELYFLRFLFRGELLAGPSVWFDVKLL